MSFQFVYLYYIIEEKNAERNKYDNIIFQKKNMNNVVERKKPDDEKQSWKYVKWKC